MSLQPSRLLANCPLCQAAYVDEAVRLVGEKGAAKLFHCTCKGCGHAMLAVILENAGWLSSVGLMTDLEAQDAVRFHSAPLIGSDECIKVHHMLEKDSQAFCRALLGIVS